MLRGSTPGVTGWLATLPWKALCAGGWGTVGGVKVELEELLLPLLP
jgi:hypothetical protein